MAWQWQLWLSPRPLHRTPNTKLKSFMSAGNMARFDILDEPDGSWTVQETHFIDNPHVRAGRSGPPLHIHLKQDEYFEVEQGILAAEIDGKEHKLTKGDGPLVIYRNSRHRFWSHPSSTESLIFRGRADPCKDEDNILDLNFLRNLTGYIADALDAGLQPSGFQLILFAHEATTLMCPPFLNWMPIWLLKRVHFFLAVCVAETILGYKRSYPEYTIKPGSD
ncbi:hypothetical protein B0I35DRAFT_194131 [Stachybotrys elegans]|uniref:Uncharacterized protein n=1 Tax=Stachybotrys elegans TaxID=80388 RepID=A0A8K0WV33_9HYPO|nr:hypothetical protein B0I35DRAFT_194131 [Stachybotrys elegans]